MRHILILAGLLITTSALAQQINIHELVQNKGYVFQAQSMSPMRGGMRQLTYGYSVVVKTDTLISELPYMGRLTQPSYGADEGLRFESHAYEYSVKKRKKDGWDVKIKFTDNHQVREFSFTIFENGRADLRVNCLDRDPISYSGTIEVPKSK